MKKEHGSASITREGRVLVMDIGGSWNLDGYLDFVERFKAAAEPLTSGHWGVLVDIRQWELATPDIHAADVELQQWTLAHGQRWRAFVTDHSQLKKMEIDRNARPVAGQIESRYFDSMEDARAWLSELGLFRNPED